jgi:hypothetical protein
MNIKCYARIMTCISLSWECLHMDQCPFLTLEPSYRLARHFELPALAIKVEEIM